MENGVATVDGDELTYEDFCDQYMAKNIPVLIQNIGKDWLVRNMWRDEATGGINYEYLIEHFGDASVPVVGYGEKSGYGEEERSNMTLREYIVMLRTSEAQRKKRYMKDWHFTRDFQDASVYKNPQFFEDDWLNWWWDLKGGDDYRFIYLGPRDSTTPLHHDVLQSYSWSINICGKKEWILFPPSETPKLKDRYGRQTVSDVTKYDTSIFPMVAEAQSILIEQDVDTALFVPSGWYHQVLNKEETLSINHNWFNAYNLRHIWSYFQHEIKAVEDEISHCRDGFDSKQEWHDHCQLMLRANVGMNFQEFDLLLAKREAYYGERKEFPHDLSFSLQEIRHVRSEMEKWFASCS